MFFVGHCQMLRSQPGNAWEALPIVVGLGRCSSQEEAEFLLGGLWVRQHGRGLGKSIPELRPMYGVVTWEGDRIGDFANGLTEEQAKPTWDLIRRATLV